MCFSIPYKVLKVEKNSVLIEGGKTIKLGRDIKVREGDYLRVIGNMATEALSRGEGFKIRQLIKRLNP